MCQVLFWSARFVHASAHDSQSQVALLFHKYVLYELYAASRIGELFQASGGIRSLWRTVCDYVEKEKVTLIFNRHNITKKETLAEEVVSLPTSIFESSKTRTEILRFLVRWSKAVVGRLTSGHDFSFYEAAD